MRFYAFCFLLFFLAISFNHLITPNKQPVYAVNCDNPQLDVGPCHAWCTRNVSGKVTKDGDTTAASGVGVVVFSIGECQKEGDPPGYKRRCNGTVTDGQTGPYTCGSLTTDANGNFSNDAYSDQFYDVKIPSAPTGYTLYGTTRPIDSWNRCTNPNSTTPVGSTSYLCQDPREGCTGPNRGIGQCNFRIDLAPPTATISGPTTGTSGTAVSYSGSGTGNGGTNISSMKIYAANNNQTALSSCPSGVTAGFWCQIGTSTSSSVSGSWTPPAAGTYRVMVTAVDSGGINCSGNPWFTYPGVVAGITFYDCGSSDDITLTVAAPAAPTITSLTVTDAGIHPSFTGTVGISGKTSAAGQGGSNWYNPMIITLNATGGNGTNKQYYIAFYDKKEGTASIQSAYSTASTFLSSIQSLLVNHPERGWLLRYDETGSKYYVWDPNATTGTDCVSGKGCFVDITSLVIQGWGINKGTTLLYTVFPTTNPRQWQVTVYKDFGGKQMYTAGYAVSSNGSDIEADLTP